MTGTPETPGWMIRVRGAVQGVGFRPFVYREAMRLGIRGWVRNDASGAEILAMANPRHLDAFIEAVRRVPPPAHIEELHVEKDGRVPARPGFEILESNQTGAKIATIVPDLATCPDCLREMADPANRRYRYPFTNCVTCGPRYTIIERIPYDRAHTTMRHFAMCPECRAEFEDPANRRFHAQPNACPVCGPMLQLCDAKGRTLAKTDEALRAGARLMREGHIIAVKGIGGFHLMADAAREDVIRELRRRKNREEKPLAVMMPDLNTARIYSEMSETEANWLASPAAPILLLRKTGAAGKLAESIAPGQGRLGIMLPYSPLHHLLLREAGIPFVATSGNASDEPICIDNDEALSRLGKIADFFLIHNRPIAHPVDDSVVRIVMDQPLILRKGRGLAPDALPSKLQTAYPVFGTGAHMKTTIAVAHHDRIIVGPHIGDLSTVPAVAAYTRAWSMLQQLHEAGSERICCDQHPDYVSTRFAQGRVARPYAVQHHVAHIHAVMAEHGLSGPVLGIVWDGTGYGDDGTIWGGEFIRVDGHGYARLAHLRPFPLPGGDAAAREPRRSALGVLHAMAESGAADLLSFTPAERRILDQAIKKGINTVLTSSAGRLFDAAAALTGLCERSAFEGHAAMRLQAEAEKTRHDCGHYYRTAERKDEPGQSLDWTPIILGLLADRRSGGSPSLMAARFHHSLAELIRDGARTVPGLPVILAGGCFQNALLLELAARRLASDGRTVYWPRRLPPNDGAISVGQVVAALHTIKRDQFDRS